MTMKRDFIARRIRERGFTIGNIADFLYVSRRQVFNYLAGKTVIPAARARVLCRMLDVGMEDLYSALDPEKQ